MKSGRTWARWEDQRILEAIWELGVLLLGSLGVPLGLALTSSSDFWPPKGGSVSSSSLPQCGYSSSGWALTLLFKLLVLYGRCWPEASAGAQFLPHSRLLPSAAHSKWQQTPQALLGSDTWILAIVFWPLHPLVCQQITARQIFLNYHNIWKLTQLSWLGVQTGDRLPGAVPVLPLVTSMTFGRLCDLEQLG